MAQPVETISAGPLLAALAPGLGGSLARFALRRADGRTLELMRPLSEAAAIAGDVLAVAMFPMLPYANLIENNVFTFRGSTYRFRPNFPPMRDTTHGSGWISPWRVAARTVSKIAIELTNDEIGAPFRFRARQSFALDPSGLTVSLELTNLGPVAMPFGFGLHPWFIRTEGVMLRYAAQTVWLEGYDGVPTEAICIPPELAFATPTSLPAVRRNLCYAGWDGRAEIIWPEWRQGLRLLADPPFEHLMLYTPKDEPHFCIEPQTHAAGALGRLALSDDHPPGMIVLEPGETTAGSVRFEPFDAD